MSGIDEQNRDVTHCDCKSFQYWTMFAENRLLGYLNPNAWCRRNSIKAINGFKIIRTWSKDELVNRITLFKCDACNRVIGRGCNMFGILCRDVRRKWTG